MSCSITIRQRKAGRADFESQLVKSDELNDCDSQVKRDQCLLRRNQNTVRDWLA
jgi:hypothetical protein